MSGFQRDELVLRSRVPREELCAQHFTADSSETAAFIAPCGADSPCRLADQLFSSLTDWLVSARMLETGYFGAMQIAEQPCQDQISDSLGVDPLTGSLISTVSVLLVESLNMAAVLSLIT